MTLLFALELWQYAIAVVLIIAVGGAALIGLLAKFYRKVGPEEALVRSGWGELG